MSQEYIEDKAVTLKLLSGSRRLAEALLIIVGILVIYLLISLLSFDSADPSWSQTAWQGPIKNYGGKIGAWIADTLLFAFGVMAYVIPLLILFLAWLLFRQSNHGGSTDFLMLGLRIIGLLALVITSCGLAAYNADDIYYFSSGGVIGNLLISSMHPWFSNLSATLFLLCVWAAGITLFTGWSWLTIAEKIGALVLNTLTLFTNHSRQAKQENIYQQDDDQSMPTQEALLLTAPVDEEDQHDPLFSSSYLLEVETADEELPRFSASTQPPVSDGRQAPQQEKTSVPEQSEPISSRPRVILTGAETASTPMADSTANEQVPVMTVRSSLAPDPAAQPSLAKLATGEPLLRAKAAEEQDAVESDDDMERRLRQEYQARLEAQEQQRAEVSVHHSETRIGDQDDEDALQEARLRQEFATAQQMRYRSVAETPVAIKDPEINQTSITSGEPVQESLIHPFLMRDDQPLPKPTTSLPTLDLLTPPPARERPVQAEELEQVAQLIEARLADYRVKAQVVAISPGPVVTLFELDLAPGVKAARISNLSRDLARSLSAVAVRIVEVIPGKPYVGLELPNRKRETVYLREVLDCDRFREMHSPLGVLLGKDISGHPVVADLAKMPHLLVAGTTGSGKSVGVNAMIISILYKATPEQVKFIMIDPKMLELSVYEGIPHLLTEVVTDMKDAANALRWCVNEMERRYKLMSALGVRNIAGYNEKIDAAAEMGRPIPDPLWKPGDSMHTEIPMLEKLPYIVVMVDEFADLIMAVGKKVEELIARLAQKARAAGIHLVLATQRPSVDVITGLIKANVPTRIAFTVSSKIDSRTILDQGGAESLLGMGDMLYLPPNSSLPVRLHGAFVRDQEVHAVVQDWKARGRPQYIDNILSGGEEGEGEGFDVDEELDPLFDQAVSFVVEKRRASISGVQRQFRIGYNRAAHIIEQMEAQGIVSAPGHNGNREVLAPDNG